MKLNQDGYLRVHIKEDGRAFCKFLHQMIWEEVNGPIPEGFEIHHGCHNRACQNINHLECIDGSLHATISNKEREFCLGKWRKEKANESD